MTGNKKALPTNRLDGPGSASKKQNQNTSFTNSPQSQGVLEFSLILNESYLGMFKRGDVLTCTTSRPLPGSIAILERKGIGRWPIAFDESGPEVANGGRVIGIVLSLHRQLFREVSQ